MLEGSILQLLEAAHRNTKRPIKFGVYYKNTLVALCHALEDHILTEEKKPLVIAAFQQGKWFLEEAERYADIAKHSQQIAIMATGDTSFAGHRTTSLPNVELVSLDQGDPVAQEWHLIILSPQFTAMVICQELSEGDYGSAGVPGLDVERKFYGLWTFEPELVKETALLAIAHIQNYNRELAEKLIAITEEIQPSFATPQDLNIVVSRVVDYLQIGQGNITVPTATRHQALDGNLVSNEIQAFLRMAQLINAADITNSMAAEEVVALCDTIGQLLDLPAWQMKRLRLASLLHRIDPLQRAESVLTPSTFLHSQEEAP